MNFKAVEVCKITKNNAKYEVLTLVMIESHVFWVVALACWASMSQIFGETGPQLHDIVAKNSCAER